MIGAGLVRNFVGQVNDVKAAILAKFSASDGASLLGFTQGGIGAIAMTLQDRGRQTVRAEDYYSAAQRADVAAGTCLLDVSAAAQAAIDANKGRRIIFGPGLHNMAGLILSGAAYNGTELVFEGELFLKARGGVGVSNFGNAWVGLVLKDCDRVTLTFRGHGNRANQPANEHCHLVGLAGVTNLSVPFFKAREVRGDGMYVSQSTWTANSANTDGVTIGLFEVTNTADDGRNALSIISGDNISIDVLRSYKVGAVVGVRQPGGLDIEPDQVYQSCKGITVGSVNVVTAGTSGLAVQGRSGTSVTRDVVIGTAKVVNTCPADVNDGAGALTATGNHTLIVKSAIHVKVRNYHGAFTNAWGDAVVVYDACDSVEVFGSVDHVREGARIGDDAQDVAGVGVINSTIDLRVTNCARFGLRTGRITRCRIAGTVYPPVEGVYPGGLFAVYSRLNPQTDSVYSVSVPKAAAWNRTYRNDNVTPATFSNVSIQGCDLSGVGWASYTAQVGDMVVPRIAVAGVTDQPAVPSGAYWVNGQYVRNSAPAVGSPKGWFLVAGVWVSEGVL